MVSLFFSLPKGGAGERPNVRRELAVLMRPQVVSALLTTVLGAGAMFTLYTYISPVLHSITHATPAFVTGMLVLIGVGFSIGNYLGGKLADRSVNGTLKGFLLLLMVIMLAIPLLARSELGAAISMVVWGAATFAVVPPLQMRVMRVASDAPGLSSSVNIGAFNLGNALGAAAGGAVISGGLGYSFVPVMGQLWLGWRCYWSLSQRENSLTRPAASRTNAKTQKGSPFCVIIYAAKFFATNSQFTSAQKCSVAVTRVAIVDVVGVFPHINGHQRRCIGGQRCSGI